MNSNSVFIIQCTITGAPGLTTDRVVYQAIDQQSGGYPWYPEDWASAQKFTEFEKAKAVVDRLKTAEPARYGCGPSAAFTSIQMPFEFGIMMKTPKVDGEYNFVIAVVEISGATLASSTISERYKLGFKITQFKDIPNKEPIIQVFE